MFAISLLVACGGGGGGNDDEEEISLQYQGNRNPTVITADNASTVVANAFSFGQLGNAASLARGTEVPPTSTGLIHISSRSSLKWRQRIISSLQTASRSLVTAARTNIDDTEFCDSGLIRITGFVNNNGTGQLTLNYQNCLEGNLTTHGTITAVIHSYDIGLLLPTDVTFSFSVLTITAPEYSFSIDGSIRSQLDPTLSRETLTVGRLIGRDNNSGGMAMIENQSNTIVYDNVFSPSTSSESLSARVFDSVLGFVDISTNVDLIYSDLNQEFPNLGELVLEGANNTTIRVTVISRTQLTIELDLDGDTTYETVASLTWSTIFDGQDLNDTDGDGMHDGWELDNGLDLNDPSDAFDDPDGDGSSNLEEYQGGSDPNDINSTPSAPDLNITKSLDFAPKTGTSNRYTITVSNNGMFTAEDVQVIDVLPPGVIFVSTTGSPAWSCAHNSGTVTCTKTSIAVGEISNFSINVVLPSATGSITNTVSVSASNGDSNSADNSDSVTSEVLSNFADMSITKSSVSAVGVGDTLTYTLVVRNNGPDVAPNVVVTDVLPPSFNLINVTSSQGSCSLTQTVSCSLGSFSSGLQIGVTIDVSPTLEGNFDNTATVSSDSNDPDSNNNSATANVDVGLSVSNIQSLIDTANTGDTISVAPGTYLGEINFIGKAITLVSTGGPLVTIIDGIGGTDPLVTFANGEGNESVLDGFTLRNGTDKGIYVSGSSPTIVNNIIENNSDCAGAGIELAFSSAIVQNNIIRDNFKSGCSGGTGGGGILIRGAGSAMIIDNHILDNSSSNGGGISLFAAGTPTISGNTISGNSGGAMRMVNFSDALIVNNVFANNVDSSCGGIDWLVPSGSNGPRVINNTFVDNDGSQGSAICADGFDIQAEIINNNIVAKSGQTAIFCDNFNDLNPPIIRNNNVTAPGGTLYAGICTDQTGLNGNVSDDPLFADAAAEDYQLGMGSPSIDAGDNAIPDLPANDILGNGRIIDGNSSGSAIVDIGAYEFQP